MLPKDKCTYLIIQGILKYWANIKFVLLMFKDVEIVSKIHFALHAFPLSTILSQLPLKIFFWVNKVLLMAKLRKPFLILMPCPLITKCDKSKIISINLLSQSDLEKLLLLSLFKTYLICLNSVSHLTKLKWLRLTFKN